jgi:glyoxalase family protein
VPRERRGTRSIVRTGLRVNGEAALEWWLQRFDDLQVPHGEVVEWDGRMSIRFEDPEGQRLALVDDGGAGDPPAVWVRSPVPSEHQIRGLGPIVISIPTLNPTDVLLTRVFNMRPVRECPHPDNPGTRVHVFEMGSGGPHAELHVAVQPDLPVTRQGAGGVHHLAFRTPDANYDAWADRLNEFGIPNSGKVDRFWFRSLYVREPNGVLFEIATDGPGFAVDEDPATLGEAVVLPPFLEPHRQQIVAHLKPID